MEKCILLIYSKITTTTFIILLLSFGFQVVKGNNTSQIALPNCPEKCGNVSIPYPFGIGKNCHYNHPTDGSYYNLTCNNSTSPPTLMYNQSIKVAKITLEGEFRIVQGVAYSCDNNGSLDGDITYELPRFPLSTNLNYIAAIGCYSLVEVDANLNQDDDNSTSFSGCDTRDCTKEKLEKLKNKSPCNGIGCCRTTLPNQGVTNVAIYALTYSDRDSNLSDVNPCAIGFIVAQDEMNTYTPFKKILPRKKEYVEKLRYPLVHTWSIGRKNCNEANRSGECLCKGNTVCLDSLDDIQWGYRCRCKQGYGGKNPYLDDCQDIDECNETKDPCKGQQEHCVNTPGNYNCTCQSGYTTSSNDPHNCIQKESKQNKYIKVILANTYVAPTHGTSNNSRLNSLKTLRDCLV